MWMVFGILSAFLLGIYIFFSIPCSPVSARFKRVTEEKRQGLAETSGVFCEADIEELPVPVQRYFRYCGYLGRPKITYMKASFSNVDFVMSEARTIRIDYYQMNLAQRPERFALISSSLYGVPFEGLDFYADGKGSMQGTLGKIIPLFDQRGESMDRSSLVTWLAECLLLPNAALQDFVVWEAIDNTHAKATVIWHEVSAGGIFTFSDAGEMLSFCTGDRTAIDMDGKETIADWSAYLGKYHSVDGILQPQTMQSVWHYADGDCVYFNQNQAAVSISYQ